jgi:hypothetical protein
MMDGYRLARIYTDELTREAERARLAGVALRLAGRALRRTR